MGDIYYTLFRHKWKILICTLIGFAGAAALFFFRKPPYISEARLFIRYVITDSRSPGPGADTSRYTSPDRAGETIMESEQEILTSLDLAKQVVEAVGAEKILAKQGGGKDPITAALLVQKNLKVDVAHFSSVIHISFMHPDPEVVQPVLREVINTYLKMHVDIHRTIGIIGDVLTQETDQLRVRLAQTEEDLRKARLKAGVFSVDDSRKAYTQQMASIRQEIFNAQAELAERTAIFEQLSKGVVPVTKQDGATEPTPLPDGKVSEYRKVVARLDQQQQREQDLLTQFTEENSRVKEIREQIAETRAAKKKMEDEFPRLTKMNVVPVNQVGTNSATGGVDLVAESARLTALQSKIKVLNSQFDQVRAEADKLDQVEGSISELRRKKELEEANYRYYSTSLEQSRFNEAMGAGKVSNISAVQAASPPMVYVGNQTKLQIGIAVGGFIFGLAWAFLIEFYFDRSIRRPADVERILGVPLFLSIPTLDRARSRKRLGKSEPLVLQGGKSDGSLVPVGGANGASALGQVENAHLLRTFHETLRDRLISYFESINLTHKPKLVAVTGLGRGSGITTTAAGLASCLSETGEGNVLLVDMTAGQGSAQHFYRGKEVVGLEDILSTRDSAQVQDKLYVVAEEPSGDKLSRILPQRFTKLVPKLKASNFDYIIFDMPPVSQISITPRLAGFMDMVLMVIESEKTDRDVVQRATNLLAKSKAHVGAVLNKTLTYVPSRIHQDYLGS